MFRGITLSAILGLLTITAASCAEPPTEDETAPAPEVQAPAEPEGPFYELTKEDITSHEGWTSMNVMFKGVKIGDKTTDVESNLGTFDKTDLVGEYYRTIYEKSSYAVYTQKMTGELVGIEIYTRSANLIADPKLKKLLSGGSLDQMHEILGMEDSAELNYNTTAMEYIYNSKGFRFAKYNLGGTPVDALIFWKTGK